MYAKSSALFLIFSLISFILILITFSIPANVYAQHDQLPIGWHDTAISGSSCSSECMLQGWTCDPDRYSEALRVQFYPDGSNTSVYTYTADVLAEPAVAAACGGYANHRFNSVLPCNSPYRDGNSHSWRVKALGIDSSGNENGVYQPLSGTPKTMTCNCVTMTGPTNLFPQGNISSGFWDLRWDAVPGAVKYPIRIDMDPGPPSTWVGNCSLPQNPGDVCDDNNTSTSYTYYFQEGHAYHWWVHALNVCGQGWDKAGEAWVTVPLPTPTNTPIPTRTPTPIPTRTPTPIPTRTPTPTPTRTPTPTPTPTTPPICGKVCSYDSNCGDPCPYCTDFACSSVFPTPTPTNTPPPTPTPTNTPPPTPTPTNTPTLTPTPTFYQIYGWVWNEANNSIVRTEEGTEGLLSSYIVNLSGDKTDSTTTQGTPIGGLLANYLFTPIYNGLYQVSLVVTPTGSVLDRRQYSYTNPQNVILQGSSEIRDFPFITVTPTSTPTNTPTNTPIPPPPTEIPTPTPTGPCLGLPLPTPVLRAPSHELCTNIKPTFSAQVSNPNMDSVWARFHSDAYETFHRMGSVVPASGGESQWTPEGAYLNNTGGYWWTATAESPACPTSIPAPGWLLNMDHQAPPQPTPPTCTFVSQDLVNGTGKCEFTCSWPADPEPPGASCSDTTEYQPVFRTEPSGGGWKPDWSSDLSNTVKNVEAGDELFSKVMARDGLDNESPYSDEVGGVFCPGIDYGPTNTPTPTGGPTLTPTNTPTPTIALTPTPGAWIQVLGGDVYQKSISLNVPPEKYFLDVIATPAPPFSGGVIFSQSASGLGERSSPTQWEAVTSSGLSNTYSFSYYWEALKDKAFPVNNIIVGASGYYDSTPNDAIYSYPGGGHFTLSTSFTPNPNTEATVFLITGTLEITQDFNSVKPVVFIVNGHIYIDGNVTTLSGLYLTGCERPGNCDGGTFSIASGPDPITIDGMVYAYNLSLSRTYRSLTPTYQFIYQPKYIIALLPYLGRSQVNWQEVKP